MNKKAMLWLAVSELNKAIKQTKKDFQQLNRTHTGQSSHQSTACAEWIQLCTVVLAQVKLGNADVQLYFKTLNDMEVLVMSIQTVLDSGDKTYVRLHLKQESGE